MPTAFYKVVYVPSAKKGIGFILPHRDGLLRTSGARNDDLKPYATTIDAVEKVTGLDFFSALPDDAENLIESIYTLTDWKW